MRYERLDEAMRWALVIVLPALLLIAVWGLVQYGKWRSLWRRKNLAALSDALPGFKGIIDDKLWDGSGAAIVATKTWNDPSGEKWSVVTRTEQLCRSKNGALFLFKACASDGEVIETSLTPLNESDAKQYLQHDIDAYARAFGLPSAA